MSSHHIVREKQEPALFIQSLAGFDHEHLGQLLEWSPVVLVDESEYERVHSIGIKVDVVITAGAVENLQENTLLIRHNGNSFLSALNYLAENGHTAVNVVTDSFALNDARNFTGKISIVIFCNGQKIYPVKRGFTKWLAAGETIRLFQPVLLLRHKNLQKLSETDYRVMHDGFIGLDFQEPVLFISESLH